MSDKKKASKVRSVKKRKALAKEVQAIARRFQRLLKEPVEDHGAFLYDERGLPK